ncbi:MAG: UDP-N-acetylmuramate dehydrogenase [Phycisphaerae bacterium]|nr:UDP-N-acetylmuramate dehydrogenase [Phycisphaerae bacterium]
MMWMDLAPMCAEHVPLGPLTWFGLGGTARVLATVSTQAQLRTVLARACEVDLPVYVLGAGANVLVGDGGVDGVVVRLKGGDFEQTQWDGPRVVAGAGVDIASLTLAAVRRGLAGLECMAGIPGTAGGTVCMNAGGRFGEIKEAVRRVWTVHRSGCCREWNQEEAEFEYRRSALTGHIIERVAFELVPDDPGRVMQRYREIWEYKKQSQPLGRGSAGCVFKNPPGESAGALIDRAGLKGTAVGGATVSEAHANFIVVRSSATASDIIELIATVQQRVEEEFGVTLEPEVQIWGDCGQAARWQSREGLACT